MEEGLQKEGKKRMKQKAKFSNSQLRQLVRPMFSSTISFGYATPEQVENTLDDMFGLDSRESNEKVCKVCPKHCKTSSLKKTGENQVECVEFVGRGNMMAEQDLQALGFWDCKCGHRNVLKQNTIKLTCDKCSQPRKFDLMRNKNNA